MCVLQEVKYYPHERCRGGLVIKISSACVPWGTKCCDAAYNYRVVSPSTSARSGFTWNCDIGGGEDQDGSGNPPHHLHNLLPSPLFPPRDPPLWALWVLAASWILLGRPQCDSTLFSFWDRFGLAWEKALKGQCQSLFIEFASHTSCDQWTCPKPCQWAWVRWSDRENQPKDIIFVRQITLGWVKG